MAPLSAGHPDKEIIRNHTGLSNAQKQTFCIKGNINKLSKHLFQVWAVYVLVQKLLRSRDLNLC